MSVFKEGYYAIQELQHNACQVYPDACDFGAPFKKNDRIYNLAKQVVEMYGMPTTRTGDEFASKIYVHLMDEHGSQQSEYFCLTAVRTPDHKEYMGYIEVYKETDDTIIDQLECELAKQMEESDDSLSSDNYNSPEHNV